MNFPCNLFPLNVELCRNNCTHIASCCYRLVFGPTHTSPRFSRSLRFIWSALCPYLFLSAIIYLSSISARSYRSCNVVYHKSKYKPCFKETTKNVEDMFVCLFLIKSPLVTFLCNETHDLWLNEPSEDPLSLNPGTHPSTKINYNIRIKDLHIKLGLILHRMN